MAGALKSKLNHLLYRLRGGTIQFDMSDYEILVEKIQDEIKIMAVKSDQELKDKSSRIINQKTINREISETTLIEFYTIVSEAFRRVLNITPFDVQLLGAIVMHKGMLAEMQTGEGKTFTAVFPACLNAKTHQGVHILTFNDYLAQRDADWMGPIYKFLDLTVGFVQAGMSIGERQQAYAADVTYLTAKEAGFDFLRDNLCCDKANLVHRPFHFALVDEADSIMIDEARIPLVIAGSEDKAIPDTDYFSRLAKRLIGEKHYKFDEYKRNVNLTDTGVRYIESELKCGNLYNSDNYDTLLRINCALHAEHLLVRDVDYIIRGNNVELVDEFTGRVAQNRRWPDGLQDALEAKEKIANRMQGNILNSITLQHFLQRYPRICGMTATAQSSEEEFSSFYNLQIGVIPQNRACIRKDLPDRIFRTNPEKENAIINEIVRLHKTEQPVLVGTQSVNESERLAARLEQVNIPCQILNAKNDIAEAGIIAEAGRTGAVTISTNMAGRGTDIKLGGANEDEKDKVKILGGLYVLGTNKHETSRIDDQLRGRAGRQGDPGVSRFFISLEDDLLEKYKFKELLPKAWKTTLSRIDLSHPVVQKEINRVQRICDGQNLEIKKTLTRYSSILENQRKIYFERRSALLNDENHIQFFKKHCRRQYKKVRAILGNDKTEEFCSILTFYYMDELWSQYLNQIEDLRESIHLRRIGGQDPFFEFQKITINLFDELQIDLDKKLIEQFNSVDTENPELDISDLGIKRPSATWTYLINDNPFENNLGLQLIGNIGMQVSAGILGPLLGLKMLFAKVGKDK
jgi:preprotein translocase subunit SecA